MLLDIKETQIKQNFLLVNVYFLIDLLRSLCNYVIFKYVL
jgi:hypothetical protein